MRTCERPDCNRVHTARGLCANHYFAERRHGRLANVRPMAAKGQGSINVHGYRVVAGALEHRAVVERSIGRALLSSENVHHRNGIKTDNRLENLEIWNTSQPAGQRPADKVAHALEIIRLYAPDLLKGE